MSVQTFQILKKKLEEVGFQTPDLFKQDSPSKIAKSYKNQIGSRKNRSFTTVERPTYLLDNISSSQRKHPLSAFQKNEFSTPTKEPKNDLPNFPRSKLYSSASFSENTSQNKSEFQIFLKHSQTLPEGNLESSIPDDIEKLKVSKKKKIFSKLI